jgi:hypothetical protein
VRGRFPVEEGALIVAALEAAQEQLASPDRPADDADRDVSAGTSATERAPGPDVSAGTSAMENQPGPDVSAGTPAAKKQRVRDVPAGTPHASAGAARADALLAVADSFLAGGLRPRTGGDRHQVLVHVELASLTGDDETGRCELDAGTPLAPETARMGG